MATISQLDLKTSMRHMELQRRAFHRRQLLNQANLLLEDVPEADRIPTLAALNLLRAEQTDDEERAQIQAWNRTPYWRRLWCALLNIPIYGA